MKNYILKNLFWGNIKCVRKVARGAGLEPATNRLTVYCATDCATPEFTK